MTIISGATTEQDGNSGFSDLFRGLHEGHRSTIKSTPGVAGFASQGSLVTWEAGL